MTERHVDDVDAERRLVRDRELDRGENVARRAAARVVEDAQANQVRIRRHAFVLAVRHEPAAGCETGHMRAVPVAVNGCRRHTTLSVREVVERGDPVREVGHRRDARVDDGDADARAAVRVVGDAEQRAQLVAVERRPVTRDQRIGADRLIAVALALAERCEGSALGELGVGQRGRGDRRVERERVDAVEGLEPLEIPPREFHRHATDTRMIPANADAAAAQRLENRCRIAAWLHDHAELLRGLPTTLVEVRDLAVDARVATFSARGRGH